MGGFRILEGGHVLTSGLSVGNKWPKILSKVGGLGGRGAWPRDPPLICPYSFIGLTQTMLTIIKSFTVYNLTTVYGHRKGNCLNMLPVKMEM